MTYALEILNLRKSYDSFLLDDVSFNVPTGSIMGFVGQNGAGKTTTIKSIMGLIDSDAGEVRAFGKTLHKNSTRQGIGVVSDTSFYDPRWKVSDAEKVSSLFYENWDTKKFNSLLNNFNIAKSKKVSELSKGMGVKLMIAVAMSHDAKLLILDEPTSGLDPVARDELCSIFMDYVKDGDKSILFSTHITSDLDKVADYVTCIYNGRIMFSSPKDEILQKYAAIGQLDDIVVSFSRRDGHE